MKKSYIDVPHSFFNEFAKVGLTAADAFVLMVSHSYLGECVSASEVARGIGVSSAALRRHLQFLTEKGLIVQRECVGDRFIIEEALWRPRPGI